MIKKLMAAMVAVCAVVSVSAQVVVTNDFEDGKRGKWTIWKNNEEGASIVSGKKAKDSKFAFSYKTGVVLGVGKLDAKSTYSVSFDKCTVWGKHAGWAMIQFYNVKTKKWEQVMRTEVPTSKAFELVTFEFKSKVAANYRITLAPDGTKGGAEFVIDNFKVEKVK